MDSVIAFLGDHQDVMFWVSILSLIFFIGSLIVIPLIVARLPNNYFVEERRLSHNGDLPGSLGHTLLVFLKNTVGILLIIAGILMLVLPGQGLLTILIGLSLSNFPGKYTLERKLAARPTIFNAMNWIRSKYGVSPLLRPK